MSSIAEYADSRTAHSSFKMCLTPPRPTALPAISNEDIAARKRYKRTKPLKPGQIFLRADLSSPELTVACSPGPSAAERRRS